VFVKVFIKVFIIGPSPANLIDFSNVIPTALPLPANTIPHLPAGKTQKAIEQAMSHQKYKSQQFSSPEYLIVHLITVPDFPDPARTSHQRSPDMIF
jgi:hypothetical protein